MELLQFAFVRGDISVRNVGSKLIEPTLDALKGRFPTDVVHNQGADSAFVVSRGDGPAALLAGSVPDLSLENGAVLV
ncbi:hypothetical protein ACFX1T_009252 [Malus domestica]